MTLADRYREAYITYSPETVVAYMSLLHTIDSGSSMVLREGEVWIEFSDGSEWKLGLADKPANTMRHHDS